MKRLFVVVLALASCKYPSLPEISSDATSGPDGRGGSGSDGGMTVDPPTGLMYSTNPATYYVDSAIAPNAPSHSGGEVASFAVSPALPDGLNIDGVTGIISGTPTTPTAAEAYTVTATNAGGSTTAGLTITVDAGAPTDLEYSPNSILATVGIAITPNMPTSSDGAITSYSVSPALPAGLSLDAATGVIGGTPTAEAAMATYTVTGSNGVGSTTVEVDISAELTGLVATGTYDTCAVASGAAKCWGYGQDGALGDGSSASFAAVPTQVSGLTSGVHAVAAGQDFACALVNSGVQCWGYGPDGELGNGTASTSYVPVQVMGLTSGVQAIAAGENHVCALVNGGVKCWGDGVNGQTGDNSGSSTPSPVQVVGLGSGVQAIAAGGNQACAIVNGGVECWGQLVNSSTPVPISGLSSGVWAITVGQSHACALVGGGVECWGNNSDGQLGSAGASSSTPVSVSNLTSGVQAIGASASSTCAILDDGDIQCWGDNSEGELGNNSTTNSSTPVQVSGLSAGGQALSAGTVDRSCAFVNGHFSCWGDDNNEALGNGSAAYYISVPVSVTGL